MLKRILNFFLNKNKSARKVNNIYIIPIHASSYTLGVKGYGNERRGTREGTGYGT